jgi:hypothetical protein
LSALRFNHVWLEFRMRHASISFRLRGKNDSGASKCWLH